MHALAPWPGYMRVLNMMQAESLQSALVTFSGCKHLSGFVLRVLMKRASPGVICGHAALLGLYMHVYPVQDQSCSDFIENIS